MIKRARSRLDGMVRITFSLSLDEAPEPVSVVGDFNAWSPDAHPLVRRSNGTRSATVDLPAGAPVEFKYLDAGGRWFLDPTADEHSPNEWGEVNARLEL